MLSVTKIRTRPSFAAARAIAVERASTRMEKEVYRVSSAAPEDLESDAYFVQSVGQDLQVKLIYIDVCSVKKEKLH